jgi:methylmalonyl-CoA mutase N-terminal domain/subunit
LEEEAIKYIKKIDEIGGMPKAIEIGFIQKQIQETSYERQKRIESGEDKRIGVNIYQIEEEPELNLFELEEGVEDKAIVALNELRKRRDEALVNEKLNELRKVAESDENIMPIMIETVKTYATIQEICDVLRKVFGEYKGPTTI